MISGMFKIKHTTSCCSDGKSSFVMGTILQEFVQDGRTATKYSCEMCLFQRRIAKPFYWESLKTLSVSVSSDGTYGRTCRIP